MKCCICGETIEGIGNSAWPFSKDSKEKCCDTCDDLVVQPTCRYVAMSWSAVERIMERHSLAK